MVPPGPLQKSQPTGSQNSKRASGRKKTRERREEAAQSSSRPNAEPTAGRSTTSLSTDALDSCSQRDQGTGLPPNFMKNDPKCVGGKKKTTRKGHAAAPRGTRRARPVSACRTRSAAAQAPPRTPPLGALKANTNERKNSHQTSFVF